MIAQGTTVGTRLTREAFADSGGEKNSKFHVVEVLRRRFRNSDVIANGNGRSTTSIPVITFIVTTSMNVRVGDLRSRHSPFPPGPGRFQPDRQSPPVRRSGSRAAVGW